MRHTLMLISIMVLAAGLASPAGAQKLDANGRCHAADGKFAKAAVCSGASKSAAKSTAKAGDLGPAAAAAPSRSTTKPLCKNDKGKFAKCGSPGAHPI